MPQEFHVIRCFSCSCFQVQLAKKATKFKCTLCGTSQTLQKVYAISSDAKDCRKVCMALNEARGEAAEATTADDRNDDHLSLQDQQAVVNASGSFTRTLWTSYVEDEGEDFDDNGGDDDMAGHFTTSADLVVMAKGREKGGRMEGGGGGGGKRPRAQADVYQVDEEEDRRRMPPPQLPSHRYAPPPPPAPAPAPVSRAAGPTTAAVKIPAQKPTGRWAAYVEEEAEELGDEE